MCKPTELKTVFKTVESSLYKTGRWTDEEHEVFVKAMRHYGKNWKEVSRVLKTRSPVQVRTHAQKFFLKTARADFSNDAKSIPVEFTSLKKDTAILSSCLEIKQDIPPEFLLSGESTENVLKQEVAEVVESEMSSSEDDEEPILSETSKFLFEEKEDNFDYNDLFLDEFENLASSCSSPSSMNDSTSDEEKDDLSVSSILNDPVLGLVEDEKSFKTAESLHVKRSHELDVRYPSEDQDVKKIRVEYPQMESQQIRSRSFDELSFADFDDTSYGFSVNALNREESFLEGFEDLLY